MSSENNLNMLWTAQPVSSPKVVFTRHERTIAEYDGEIGEFYCEMLLAFRAIVESMEQAGLKTGFAGRLLQAKFRFPEDSEGT